MPTTTPHSRMTQAATKARIKFLAASADTYARIAPATSAHLMLECENVAASNDLLIKRPDSRQACKACGTTLISGWTSNTSVVNPAKSGRRRHRSRNDGKDLMDVRNKLVRTQCLVCHRWMSSPLEHAVAPGIVRKKDTMSQSALSVTVSSSGVTDSISDAMREPQIQLPTNAASRKRAKARKQGGLQAMLQKAESDGTKVFSPQLGLMDFMKLS